MHLKSSMRELVASADMNMRKGKHDGYLDRGSKSAGEPGGDSHGGGRSTSGPGDSRDRQATYAQSELSPHAKFHNGQTIWLDVFFGLLAIFLLWFPERDWVFQCHLAVIVVALYWLSMLGASLLPGTRWVDPEFASQTRAILGMPPQLFLMNVLQLCLIASEIIRTF